MCDGEPGERAAFVLSTREVAGFVCRTRKEGRAGGARQGNRNSSGDLGSWGSSGKLGFGVIPKDSRGSGCPGHHGGERKKQSWEMKS